MAKVKTNADVQAQLDELAKEFTGKIVIADLYQLGRVQGKLFSLESRELRRTAQKVEFDYASVINGQWGNCGKFYDIDVKASRGYQTTLAEHKEVLKEKDDIATKAAEGITNAIKAIVPPAAKKAPAAKEKKAEKRFGVNAAFEVNEVTTQEQIEESDFLGTEAECNKYVSDNKPKSKGDLYDEFIANVLKLKIKKADLQKLCVDNNIPEDEFIDMNATALTTFAADKLCEIPGILEKFIK